MAKSKGNTTSAPEPISRAYDAIDELAKAAAPQDATLAAAARKVAETALLVLLHAQHRDDFATVVGGVATISEREIIRRAASTMVDAGGAGAWGVLVGSLRREIEALGGPARKGMDPVHRARTALVRIEAGAPAEYRQRLHRLMVDERLDDVAKLLSAYTSEKSRRGKTARDAHTRRKWQAIAADLLVLAGIESKPATKKDRSGLEDKVLRAGKTFHERAEWLAGKSLDEAARRAGGKVKKPGPIMV